MTGMLSRPADALADAIRMEVGPLPLCVELDIIPRHITEPLDAGCDCGDRHLQQVTCEVWWQIQDPINPHEYTVISRLVVRSCVAATVREAALWADRVTVELGLLTTPVMVPVLSLPWYQDRRRAA